MSWVFLYTFLLLTTPLGLSDPDNLKLNDPAEHAWRGNTEVVNIQAVDAPSRPAWSKSVVGRFLFVALVIALLFAGAYGIHLYQIKHLHHRADSLEVMVAVRTAEIKRINEVHEGVIDALTETTDALTETSTLLASAKEQLTWANNQLLHTNDALEARTEELDYALEQNQKILDTTVHDLKEPLGGVLGLAGGIEKELALHEKQDHTIEIVENLGLIKQSTQRMLSDVELLLDTYDTSRQRVLDKAVVYINDIIETALRWNGQQARNKGLKVYFNGHRERIAVHVDVSAMQKVMDRLISNAIRYSALHGKIWVEMIRQKQDVWVSVRDQGPGLSDEDLACVFGSDERVHAQSIVHQHTSEYNLSIVKKIIEQHGGQVDAHSVLGEGAVFWFKIGAVEPELSDGENRGVVTHA